MAGRPLKDPDEIRYDEDVEVVEVKVSRHVAGDERPEWSSGEVRRSFFMLEVCPTLPRRSCWK